MRRRSIAASLTVMVVLAGACTGGDPDEATVTTFTAQASTAEPTTTTVEPTTTAPRLPEIRIRGQAFSESETLAAAYGLYLDAEGYNVEILGPEGRRAEAIDGLRRREVDMIIDYLGGAQAELVPEVPLSTDPDDVHSVITQAFAEIGATVLDYSRADDDDALVVRGDSPAERISDLRELDVVFGAAAECFEREQCYLGYIDPEGYDIEFADTEILAFGPALGTALDSREVDAVQWNATAPQIIDRGFHVLEDDLELHPAQNVVPVVSTDVLAAYGDDLAHDIDTISALLTTEDLREWNVQVDIFDRAPADVALEWLEDELLLSGETASASDFVADLQEDLAELGYYAGPINGVYSLATEDAVRRFQADVGLPPTGRYDEDTAEAIELALERHESAATMGIQRILASLGWYTGPINGVYGPDTTEAVRQFQAFLGVTADGIVGPETTAAYEAQCGNPTNCRRPVTTTLPPATTVVPATSIVATTSPTPSTTTTPTPSTTTTPSPSTTAAATTTTTTTTAPVGPTVRLESSDLGLDETYDVVTCVLEDSALVGLTAMTDTSELMLDATTITLTTAAGSLTGPILTVVIGADDALEAMGTFETGGSPKWELSGTCAMP